MELMQLEMLIAVVEEGGLRRAAERVRRTQPAISIALHKLEDEIDAPIFDRRPGATRALTPTGRVLYDYARRMIALRREALVAVRQEEKPRNTRNTLNERKEQNGYSSFR